MPPRRARTGRGPPARGLAWLGACPAFNERCLNNSASGWSVGTRRASVSWRSRRTRTRPLAAVASHPRVRHPLSAARLPIALEFRRRGATNRLADAARRRRTRGEHQSPSDPDRRVLVLPLSIVDDPKSSTESTIEATTRSGTAPPQRSASYVCAFCKLLEDKLTVGDRARTVAMSFFPTGERLS
jgi:hypothetical protein